MEVTCNQNEGEVEKSVKESPYIVISVVKFDYVNIPSRKIKEPWMDLNVGVPIMIGVQPFYRLYDGYTYSIGLHHVSHDS